MLQQTSVIAHNLLRARTLVCIFMIYYLREPIQFSSALLTIDSTSNVCVFPPLSIYPTGEFVIYRLDVAPISIQPRSSIIAAMIYDNNWL